jgi:chromosomal replication initiator protein
MTLAQLLCRVALERGVSVDDMKSNTRVKAVTDARREFFYRARKDTGHSSPAIGRACNKDHSTVLYGAAKHKELEK